MIRCQQDSGRFGGARRAKGFRKRQSRRLAVECGVNNVFRSAKNDRSTTLEELTSFVAVNRNYLMCRVEVGASDPRGVVTGTRYGGQRSVLNRATRGSHGELRS